MSHPDYNSPSSLKLFLEDNNMGMQKKFGQNFMLNPDARKKIVENLELEKDMQVWEIGPGLGCITEELLNKEADVTVFEIDRGFISLLHKFYENYENQNKLKIIEGDCLKTWQPQFKVAPSTRLVGNLPYNIAATFIADTITNNVVFNKCVFTIQKEVAERMSAKHGTSNYSSFSVLCQWKYDLKIFQTLAPGNFWPRPNVSSSSILLTKKEQPLACDNPTQFVNLIHTLFSSRRKTIKNNIKKILPPEISDELLFKESNISPSARAEELSVEQLITLSQNLSSDIIKLNESKKKA